MKAFDYQFNEHGVTYKVGRFLQPFRPQNKIIVDWVKVGSKLLDAACGDGVLGKKLIEEKNCQVYGLDLDEQGVAEAKRHKIKAKVWDLDAKFPYSNKSFDFVICSDSLQYLKQPNFAIGEMLRVGKTLIIQFPNFGFWFYRLQMLTGRFPGLSLFGHTWWDSQLARMFSLKDFLSLPVLKNVQIKRITCINWRNRKISLLARLWPNFFGRSCILEITAQDN